MVLYFCALSKINTFLQYYFRYCIMSRDDSRSTRYKMEKTFSKNVVFFVNLLRTDQKQTQLGDCYRSLIRKNSIWSYSITFKC